MRYTDFDRITELINMFEEYWVKHRVLNLGMSDGGQVQGVFDMKANTLYLETYNTSTYEFDLHKFSGGEFPSTWRLDNTNGEVVDINL